MKSLIFATAVGLALASWAQVANAQTAPKPTQCTGALIKHYWNNMHLVIDVGTMETKPDDKANTLQIILVNELPANKTTVSADGQIVYTSNAALSAKGGTDRVVMGALVRRIKAGSGIDCSGNMPGL